MHGISDQNSASVSVSQRQPPWVAELMVLIKQMTHIFCDVLSLRLQLWYGYTGIVFTTLKTILVIPENQECIKIAK